MFCRLPTLISKCSSGLCLSISMLLVLSACGSKDQVGLGKDPLTSGPKIEKGTDPTTQVNSESDLFILAFEELGWNRRSADIAIHKIARDSQQGCVNYKHLSGTTFATAQYACSRLESSGVTSIDQRRELGGREEFREDRQISNSVANFTQRLYRLATGTTKEKLIGRGTFVRTLKTILPKTQESTDPQSTYTARFESRYRGEVAEASERTGETFDTLITGNWESSHTDGDYLAADAALSMTYMPEQTIGTKGGGMTLSFTASSDIDFAAVSKCLRPIGTFNWTLKQGSQTKTGTIKTSEAGYIRNGETETTPWGTRCLEK